MVRSTRAGGRGTGGPLRRRPPARALAAAAVTVAVAVATAACTAGPAHEGPANETPAASASAPDGPGRTTTEPTLDPSVFDSAEGGSEVGALVEGFPADLLPLPDDAVVLVTSAVPVGGSRMHEVSLNFHTRLPVAELVELYRTALTGAGFSEVETAAPQSDLAAESTFVRSRGDELVSIGVLDTGEGRTVTIGGRVATDEG